MTHGMEREYHLSLNPDYNIEIYIRQRLFG